MGINRFYKHIKRFPLPARFHPLRHTFASPQQILTHAKAPSTPVAGKQRKYLNRHSPPKKQHRKIERKNNRLKINSRTAKTDNRSTNVNLAFRRDIAHHHILTFSHTHIPPFSTHRNISPTDDPLFSTSIAAGSQSATHLYSCTPPERSTPEITPADDSEGHA